MVTLTTQMKSSLAKYIERLSRQIVIDQVILFGSRATKYARPDSDIDMAIISPSFAGKRSLDVITFLLSQKHGLNLHMDPLGFTPEEFLEENPGGVLDEIQQKGIIIFNNGRFLLKRGKKIKVYA